MHKCDDNGGDFFTTIVSTFMGKCKKKRTATLGSTGREGGSQLTARLATFHRTQVSLTQATDLASGSVWNTSKQGFGMVYLACQFSCRHTRYITFVLLCLTQTNKPSLRLSISPKKGYVVKFSTVATEWLRVHRSRGNGFGNIWREFIDLHGIHFKTSFALWRFQVPSRFVQVAQYPAR